MNILLKNCLHYSLLEIIAMVIYIIKYCYFVFKLNCPASGFYLCEDENFYDLLEDHVLSSFCTLLVEDAFLFKIIYFFVTNLFKKKLVHE